MKIDRMELDDVGGNPEKLAMTLIDQLSDFKPPLPVRDIAVAVGIIEIKEESLYGLEGALITGPEKVDGIILVNADASAVRKRFTIGHELGHYLNPYHRPTSDEGFRCSPIDMKANAFVPGDYRTKMEVEANQFSAELLLPRRMVRLYLRNRRVVDLEHILEMAEDFGVSKEAAARRYVTLQDEPMAVVFSCDGRVRYYVGTREFPALGVRKGDVLPLESQSARSRLAQGKVSDWIEIDGGIWLPIPNAPMLCEQTVAQANGYRITLLAYVELEPIEDDEPEWDPPTFRR